MKTLFPFFPVGAEWAATPEACARVQRLGGYERRIAAGFEVQNLIPTRTSDIDDVIEKRSTRPRSTPGARGAHRLDLALRR